MRKKLLSAGLEKLPAGDYSDTLSDVQLRVGANRRTWFVRYRKGGKRHSERLGYFPSMSLSQAREAAAEVALRVESGIPITPEPVGHPKNALTVGGVIDLYEKFRRNPPKPRGKKAPAPKAPPKSLDHALHTVRRNLSDFLDLAASEFGKGHVRAVRDEIADRGAEAMSRRFLGYLGPIWKWAASEEYVETNPVPTIVRKGSETKRERILTDDELRAVWIASLEMKGTAAAYGRLLRFLVLTGCRIDEAASMRHRDVLGGQWKQTDNKSSRPVLLKLPPSALDLIGHGEPNDLVFAGRFDGKISGYSKLKATLDKDSGVTGWRHHDLRRSMASGLQDLDFDELVIKRVLNHSIGGLSETYMRSTLEPQKAKAFAAWADRVAVIVDPKRKAAS